ncbi:MAG: class II aldolase/adducin family protein [Actinomycetota bacterium]|nr:class II aldolase/adducin family protein [Actinomycetota bacterium]
MLEQLSLFGHELFLQEVNYSQSGNISARMGDRISLTCRGSTPVVSAGLTVGSNEVAEKLPPLLQDYKAAIVRGHGSFAVSQMPEEVFQWTSSLEASCKTLFLHRLLSPGEEKGEGEAW